MILQVTNHTDYFIVTVFISPLLIFLIIKLVLYIFKKSHLNKRVFPNLLHFVISVIIAALFYYIYDAYGTYVAEKYINDKYTYFTENEVNIDNYKNFSWDRKLASHDGFYVIDERLTFEKNGTIKLFNRGISVDNWFLLKQFFNLNDVQGYIIYDHIFDSLYACEERTLFGDTVYFFYNDSLKFIETDLYW